MKKSTDDIKDMILNAPAHEVEPGVLLCEVGAENSVSEAGTAPITAPDTAPAALPDGYLSDGFYATTDKGAKYLRPEYIGAYAQKIAASLAPMKPSDFAGMLREMKRNKKGTLPFEARETAALEMRPKAISLVRRKKAPKILCDFVTANIAAIHNDEEWMAFYRHSEAILGFLYDTEVNRKQEGTAEADGER